MREPNETASAQSTISVVMIASLTGGWCRAGGVDGLDRRPPTGRPPSAGTGRDGRGQPFEGGPRVEGLGDLHVVADEREDQRPPAGVGGDPGQGAGAGQGPGLGADQSAAGAVGVAEGE